ncbi:MAG: hypothetical protein BWY80_01348 [Firmicutes bacterium ADurb.Bin456]|nr:MAG: hypothetical protein BWY80_01348 [Firmicutes bacterium ADurb.Bin456]
MLDHTLGYVEVSDYPVSHGSDSHNIPGGTADHSFCFFPDGQDVAAILLDRHHRGLPDYNTLSLDVNQGIGGTQIHAHIFRK